MKYSNQLFTLIVLSGLAACGSLDEGRELTSLTGAETIQLCEEAQDRGVPRDAEIGAAKFGCFFAEIGDECDDARVDACVEMELNKPDESSSCEESQLYEGCTATIGEMNVCIDDVNTAWAKLAKVTCADQGEDQMVDLDPESCKSLQMKCPTVFGE